MAALVTAAIAGMAGVWLALAPLALGYPEDRAYGSIAGRIDLGTGGGLCAVAVLTGVVWAIAWRRRLRTDGVLPRRTARPAVRAVPPEEAQTQVIPVPEELRTTPGAPAAAAPGPAPVPGTEGLASTVTTVAAEPERAGAGVASAEAAAVSGDGGPMDLRALLAPLVDALAEDTARGGGERGFAGRPAYDYAEETW
ncbi:MAG TPA: hypothetical protein VGL93_06345 [Streptosporangiaceae bacterium]|jgi:hypothetical protein